MVCAPGHGWSGSVRLAYSGRPGKRDWSVFSDSVATETIEGKSRDEAVKLSNEAVADALGGLPAQKMHCSNLAADAVRAAIEDYWSKNKDAQRKLEKSES